MSVLIWVTWNVIKLLLMSGIIITLSITKHEDQPLALTMSNLGFKKEDILSGCKKVFLIWAEFIVQVHISNWVLNRNDTPKDSMCT